MENSFSITFLKASDQRTELHFWIFLAEKTGFLGEAPFASFLCVSLELRSGSLSPTDYLAIERSQIVFSVFLSFPAFLSLSVYVSVVFSLFASSIHHLTTEIIRLHQSCPIRNHSSSFSTVRILLANNNISKGFTKLDDFLVMIFYIESCSVFTRFFSTLFMKSNQTVLLFLFALFLVCDFDIELLGPQTR